MGDEWRAVLALSFVFVMVPIWLYILIFETTDKDGLLR